MGGGWLGSPAGGKILFRGISSTTEQAYDPDQAKNSPYGEYPIDHSLNSWHGSHNGAEKGVKNGNRSHGTP